jgi:hypothetical protein
MLGDVGKFMRAGIDALLSQRPDELLGRVQRLADQMASFAAGLVEWSAEARASLTREIKDLVARQVQEMGVATGPDLDVIRARLDRLEKEMAGAALTAGTGLEETKPGARSESKGARSRSRAAPSRSRAKPSDTASKSTRSRGVSPSRRSASGRTGTRKASSSSSASAPG